MSGRYVPPHLRGKAAAASAAPAKPGIRFPSNAAGDPSQNVKYAAAPKGYREGNLSRSAKAAAASRKLGTRKLRAKPVKSILKRGKTAKLRARSANKPASKKKMSGTKSA